MEEKRPGLGRSLRAQLARASPPGGGAAAVWEPTRELSAWLPPHLAELGPVPPPGPFAWLPLWLRLSHEGQSRGGRVLSHVTVVFRSCFESGCPGGSDVRAPGEPLWISLCSWKEIGNGDVALLFC